MQTPSGNLFDDVENQFPFSKGIKSGGHGTDIVSKCTEKNKMIAQAKKFAQQSPEYTELDPAP